MRNYNTLQQEDFSFAYVKAMAAVIGCSMNRFEPDNKGFDYTLVANVPSSRFNQGMVNLQLKSTTTPCVFKGGNLSYSLTKKHYNALVTPTAAPSILIVLFMPKNKDKWLDFTAERLHLYNRAYWWSTEGNLPIADKAKSISITLKQMNLVTPGVLENILTNAANNKTPMGEDRK